MNLDAINLDKLSFDSSQALNLSPEMLLFKKIHIFRRQMRSNHSGLLGPNIHSQYVLWYCLEGRGALVVDNISYHLERNEAMLIFPGQPHMRMPIAEYNADWLLIRFEVEEPKWLNSMQNVTFHISAKSEYFLKNLIESFSSGNATDFTFINECAGWLFLFLNVIRRDTVNTRTFSSIHDSRNSLYVKQVCELLMNARNKSDPFEQIAKRWNITPEHLRRVFRKTVGRSPAEIILEIKMSKARHLLSNTALSITEIAFLVGFESVYSFSRFFHKNEKMSPRQYRGSFVKK